MLSKCHFSHFLSPVLSVYGRDRSLRGENLLEEADRLIHLVLDRALGLLYLLIQEFLLDAYFVLVHVLEAKVKN